MECVAVRGLGREASKADRFLSCSLLSTDPTPVHVAVVCGRLLGVAGSLLGVGRYGESVPLLLISIKTCEQSRLDQTDREMDGSIRAEPRRSTLGAARLAEKPRYFSRKAPKKPASVNATATTHQRTTFSNPPRRSMADEELSVLILSISDLSLVSLISPPAAIDWV